MQTFINLKQAQIWAKTIELAGRCTVLKQLESGVIAKYELTPFLSFYYEGILKKS